MQKADAFVEIAGHLQVTDAEVWETGDRRVLTAAFLNVSREHVVVITPD